MVVEDGAVDTREVCGNLDQLQAGISWRRSVTDLRLRLDFESSALSPFVVAALLGCVMAIWGLVEQLKNRPA